MYLTDGNQTDSILKARDKCVDTLPPLGSGDSSVDRAPDSLSKVSGSSPGKSGGRIVFSGVHFHVLTLIPYSFQPRVTAVARKISRSFCQKCTWQVTTNHACTLGMWICVKLHDMVHGVYGVHRAPRDGSSFTWHQLCNNQTVL